MANWINPMNASLAFTAIIDLAPEAPNGTSAKLAAAMDAADAAGVVPDKWAFAKAWLLDAGIGAEAEAKAEVLAFAAEFPTANVAKMVALAEAGTITWTQAQGIAAKALAAGLVEVTK
jgi:hypothetical protein